MGFHTTAAFALTPVLVWLVALYFIKSKPRHRVIPSTAFWEMVIDRIKENALWQRYRGTIFLVLQLLAAAAAIVAMANPYRVGGVSGDVIVTIDTSASMRARDGGPTRFDSARAATHQLLDTLTGDVRVAVVELGARPRVVVPFTADVAHASAVVAGLACTDAVGASSAEIASVLGALRTDATRSLFVFGDGFDVQAVAMVLPNVRIDVRTFGSSSANVGITAFDVTGSVQRATVAVRVANFGDERFDGHLELQGVTSSGGSRELVLPARGPAGPSEQIVVFGDLQFPHRPEVVRARVRGAGRTRDILAADDQAWVLIRRERVRVAVVTRRTPRVIMRLLATMPHLEPFVMDPDDVRRRPAALRQAAVVIADEYVSDEIASMNSICFHPLAPSSLSAGTVVVAPKHFVVDTTHPVVRYLGFPDLSIHRGVTLDTVQGGTVLISSEHGPLVVCLNRGEGRQVVCAFPLEQSNLAHKVGFPVFLTNALRWILGDDLQLTASYRCGDVVVPPAGTGTFACVRGDPVPGGDLESSTVVTADTTASLDVFREVGVYEIRRGEQVVHYPVNLLNHAESDITPRGPAQVVAGEEATAAAVGARAGYWKHLALLCLVVVVVEWVLYCLKGT